MVGLEPISYQELDAWSRLTDKHPEPYEVDALMKLDAVVRHASQPEKKKG